MVGTPFGRYRLLESLGAGGMAQVYRAESEPVPGIRRAVAIKKIRPGAWGAGYDMDAMLLDEARVWVRLHHPNIVSVVDFGEVDGEWFLALELVEGATADELVTKRGPLPVLEALCIADRVARALGYAHALRDEDGNPLRVVHRDVKPSNVLLSVAGEVKLTDFGIARAAGLSSTTQVGFVKGSLHYFSPEQARGEPLDGRSDLFALGCLLHELLMGRTLFLGSREQVLRDVAAGRVPRPAPQLPAGVRELLGSLLSASREDRIQSGEEAVSAIRVLLSPQAAEELEPLIAERVATVRGAGDMRVPTRPLRPDVTPAPRRKLDEELPPTRALAMANTVPSEHRTARRRRRRRELGAAGLAAALLTGTLLYRLSQPTDPPPASPTLEVVQTAAPTLPVETLPETLVVEEPPLPRPTRTPVRVQPQRPSKTPQPQATTAAVAIVPATPPVTETATPVEDTDDAAVRRAQQVVARAVAQHRGGDALGALRALENARRADPDNGHLLFLAGSELQGSLREIGAAVRMFRLYLDAPESVFRKQDPDLRAQNLDHVRYVLAENDRVEQSSEIWLSTCRTLRNREGLIEQATRELERLVARHPGASDAWFELATSRSALRKHDGTCSAFARFLELVPTGERADYARRERSGLRCP